MGFASYTLPDGREAGYAVEATCDADGCETKIDRGLGYLCGDDPDGWRDSEAEGCGRYFCSDHKYDHDCPNPACDDCEYTGGGESPRWLAAGHEGPHRVRPVSDSSPG